jgi:hypothetical protein
MTAAILSRDWDDPASQGFRDRIAAAVQTMEQADGFIASEFDESPVWGDLVLPKAVDRPEFANRYAYTLSLWEDLDAVFAYAYHAAHGEALRHRAEWFCKGDWPVYVAWWVDDDHIPTLREAAERNDHYHQFGSTPTAFDFKHAFDAHGNPIKIDRQRVREKASKLPEVDWRETVE